MQKPREIRKSVRGRVRNWEDIYKWIERQRADYGVNLEYACVEAGIAYSTYHCWKKRLRCRIKTKSSKKK